MTLEMWIALAILGSAIVLFITEWLRVDLVAISVVIALMLTGLLTTGEAVAGFANSAVITIAALFVVGGAVMHTGLAGLIGRRILAIAGTSEVRLIVVLMLAVALLSGFMSDTGTVAVLLPAVISLAWGAKVSPSKLLIPLSFGSLLGGAMTLIGTPPNIIVSDLLKENGLEPFGFFSYTPVGVMLLIVGIVFMVFVGRKLLPDNKPKQEVQRIETPDELMDIYRLPESLFRLRVRRGSPVVGKSLADSGLYNKYGLTVLDIRRPAEPRAVVKFGEQQLVLQSESMETIIPDGKTVISIDDFLIVRGDSSSDVSHAAASLNLGIQSLEADDKQVLNTEEAGIAEILLPPRSSLLGKTVAERSVGSRYKITVLGIHRPGATEDLDIKTTTLQFGDTLLVQGPWHNILDLKKHRRDFIVMGQPESMLGAPNKSKAPIALLIMAGMLILMVTKILPTATASMVAALAMVLTGCLSMDEAYESVNWKSVVLIAGMIPMATALEKVGLIDVIADGMVNSMGGFSPMILMGALFLLTAIFTQVISNTATTVLVAPIALVAAQQLGVNPHPMVMAVAIAASMAFASPVASPVNTLVMGAGNYRFGDYIKIGVPMLVLSLIITLIGVPIFFPF